jgi:hypothetical protein
MVSGFDAAWTVLKAGGECFGEGDCVGFGLGVEFGEVLGEPRATQLVRTARTVPSAVSLLCAM